LIICLAQFRMKRLNESDLVITIIEFGNPNTQQFGNGNPITA